MAQQSIRKNSVLNVLKTVSSVLFPLITFPYISRVLQPENIGKINFGISIVSYFNLIASLGVMTYAIRECSAVRDDKIKFCEVASQIFSINIVTTIVSYVVLAITLLLCSKLENYRTLIVIQSLSIVAITVGADWINFAMEDFKYITFRSIGFQILGLILMFIFVHKPEDYLNYVVISLISTVGANIMNIWYRRKYCDIRFTLKIKWKRHFTPILILFVMILAQTLFNSVDVTMISFLKGDVEVGIYSIALKIANLIVLVVVASAWVIMPRMANYFADGNFETINIFLRKILGYYAFLGLPCVIGTLCISKELIPVFAGDEYLDAVPVLQILMFGFAFDLFGNSFIGNIICLPLREEKVFTITWIFASVINIILNSFLIPIYGARAAAGTTAFCHIFSLIVLILFINNNIKLKSIFWLLLKPIIGCIVMALACYMCDLITNLYLRLTIKVLLGILVYFMIQLVLKSEMLNETYYSIKFRFAKRKLNMEKTR